MALSRQGHACHMCESQHVIHDDAQPHDGAWDLGRFDPATQFPAGSQRHFAIRISSFFRHSGFVIWGSPPIALPRLRRFC